MKATEYLKLGLIGCGNVMINDHAPALRSLDHIVPTALADPTPNRLKEGLEVFGLSSEAGYASHLEMLENETLDYVVVAVPPHLRPEIIIDCARANVPVLAEKPLATVPSEAWASVEKMRTRDLNLGVVHNYLYFPEYVLIRDLLAQEKIGSLRHLQLNLMGVPDHPGHAEYLPQWRHDPSASGGGVLMDIIHVLYVVEFLAGSKIVAVQGIVDRLKPEEDPVEDTVLIQLFLESAYATINLGWGHGPGGLLIAGSSGRLIAQYEDFGSTPFEPLERIAIATGGELSDIQLPRPLAPDESLRSVHQDFAAALRQKRKPQTPGEEGARTLENALAVYASAVEGKVVNVPMDRNNPVFLQGLSGLNDIDVWHQSPAYQKELLLLKHGEMNP